MSSSHKLLERRRSSEISHINRIRDANSKRQFIPIWADLEENRVELKSVGDIGKSSSASAIKEKTSHENCVPYRSGKRLGSPSTEDDKVKDASRTSSEKEMHKKFKERRSSVNKKKSREKSTSREPIAPNQRFNTKKSRLKKALAQDASREFIEKPSKVSKRRSSKNSKIKTKLKPKSTRSKTRKASKVVKRDQNARKKLNENEYSENHLLDSDPVSEDSAYDMVADYANLKKTKKSPKTLKQEQKLTKNLNETEYLEKHLLDSDQDSGTSAYNTLANAANLKKPVTAKDIIVLKWLHKMKCPEASKSDASEESLFSKGDQKHPIEIIKSPSAIKAKRERYEDISKKNIKSESLEFHPSIEHVSLEGISPKSVYSENVNLEASKSKEYQQTERKDSFRDVEMRVTELGKLHIVLNLKSLSPEDSAVIVWLDDLPRSDMKPDFKKRLSISSLQSLQLQKQPSVLKSHSAQALEDEPSPKPNIYFPSVTILKNLAVDSKSKLRDLKVDPSDSVFYKRCNLSHSEDLLQF